MAVARSASLEGNDDQECGSLQQQQQQQQQQPHQLCSVSSFDPQDENEDTSSKKRAAEPCNKIRRSSPTPSEKEEAEGDDDGDEEEELLRINHPRKEEEGSLPTMDHDEEDSKPSAEDAKRLQQPLAPSLKDYMKPGATSRFRPRPEWYQATPNDNHRNSNSHNHRKGSTGRRRRRTSSPAPRVLETVGLAQPAVPSYLPAGLMVAPDNGLLLDGFFDVPFEDNATVGHSASVVNHNHHPAVQPLLLEDSRDRDRPEPQRATETQMVSLLGAASSSQESQDSSDDPSVPPPSTFGRDCDPALHVTARENATEAALALIECGAPLEAENTKGITPLMLASQKGNVRLVQELLRRGASPSHGSANGTTAVLQASHFGHLDCLEYCLGL